MPIYGQDISENDVLTVAREIPILLDFYRHLLLGPHLDLSFLCVTGYRITWFCSLPFPYVYFLAHELT